MAKKNGDAGTFEHGGLRFRSARGGFLPLWTPQSNEDHPKEVVGVFANPREVEGVQGKRKWKSLWFDVQGQDGDGWAVACNEGLQAQVEEEKLGGGETVLVRFLGIGKKKKGQNPPNLFRLFVEV